MTYNRKSKLSEAVICQLYRDGMSRFDISLRSHLYDREVVEILRRHGVELRTPIEVIRFREQARRRQVNRAVGKAAGSSDRSDCLSGDSRPPG